MGKRKPKQETSADFIDDDDEGSDPDFVVEEKPEKSRKTPTKQEASGSPKKKRDPPPPRVTEPQTQPDGWTLHPPSLIYRCHAAVVVHASELPDARLTGKHGSSVQARKLLMVSDALRRIADSTPAQKVAAFDMVRCCAHTAPHILVGCTHRHVHLDLVSSNN